MKHLFSLMDFGKDSLQPKKESILQENGSEAFKPKYDHAHRRPLRSSEGELADGMVDSHTAFTLTPNFTEARMVEQG